jgi:hypothetical protein
MAQDPLEELIRRRTSAVKPSADPLEELIRRRDLMKNTAMPAIMEDEPFAVQRPTTGVGPRRGMGQLEPVVTTAKAPNTFERATAAMRPPVGKDEELTDEQRMQAERALAFRGYGEDVAAQVVGQPKRTFYRAATGLSKFINPAGTEELSGIMREAEESTKPKTGLGKGARLASEIGQYLPFGLVSGATLAGLESSANPETSLANTLSNTLGAGDIRDSRVRAALDMALVPAIGKAIGVAAPYVARGVGETVSGARNLAKTFDLDFGSGMSRGIGEGAREAVDVATPNLRVVGPTPEQSRRAAQASTEYDKEVAAEVRDIIRSLGYTIDDKTPGTVRRRPVPEMASDADAQKYLRSRDEAAAWQALLDDAAGTPQLETVKALMTGAGVPAKSRRAVPPVAPKTEPVGGQTPAALSDEAQASYEAYLANLPPESALDAALTQGTASVAKRRGRPPKAPPTPEELAAAAAQPPRKRGRPRKVPAEQPALDIPKGATSPRLISTLGGAAAGGATGALTAEPGDTQSAITRGVLGALAGGAGGAMLGKMLPEAGAASRAAQGTPEIYASRAAALAEDFDPAMYTNVARFSEDPRVQDRLLAATEEMVRTKDVPLRTASGRLRNPETLDAMRQRVAADMGIDVKDVATRTKSGEPIGRDDMLRVKTALDMAMDEETALALKLAKKEFGSPGMTEQALAAEEKLLATNLARVEADRRALMEVFDSQRTSKGRDFNALKAMSLRNFDPAAWEVQLERYAQRPLTQGERIAARAAAAEKDANKLMQLGNEVKKATTMEKAGTFFQANLLTSPATQSANIGGNLTEAVLETAKDAPAALMDRLLSVRTGIRTKDFDPMATMNASFKAVGVGMKEFPDVMRGKVLPGQALTDVPREVNYDTPLLNYYTKGILRSLSATDNVFRKMALYRANAEQARVIAKAEKLAPSSKAYADRVAELAARPTIEMEANSILAADVATFQSDSKLARAAGAFAKAGGGAGKFLFPFTRTPANIVMQTGYSYTPLALVGELKNMAKLLNSERPKNAAERQALVNLQRQISENIGRASIGSAAIKLGIELAKRDRMTGFFPQDQRTRDEWEQQGKMEGSVRIGGKWYQVARLSPLGNLMQIGAAMHEAKKGEQTTAFEKGKAIAATATSPLRTVAELPMVSNLKDLIEMGTQFGQEESVDAAAKIAARTAGGFFPASSLVSTVGRVIDRTPRETKGATALGTVGNEMLARNFMLDALSRGVGFSQPLPEKVGPLGTIRTREGGVLSTLFSPVATSTALPEVNPLIGEMARTGAVAGRIKREEGETGQQFAEREKMTGAAIATVMSSIINTPGYQQLNAMPTSALRQLLEQSGQSTENISDDKIRARVQGYLLEQAMAQTKTLIAEERAKGKTTPSGAKALIKSIVR